MKYKLRVNTKNKTFVVKGRPIRTPLTIENLNEKELNFYLSKIRLEGILDKDYIIEEMTTSSKPKTSSKNPRIRTEIYNKENEDQDLNDDKSTLEKIMNEDSE